MFKDKSLQQNRKHLNFILLYLHRYIPWWFPLIRLLIDSLLVKILRSSSDENLHELLNLIFIRYIFPRQCVLQRPEKVCDQLLLSQLKITRGAEKTKLVPKLSVCTIRPCIVRKELFPLNHMALLPLSCLSYIHVLNIYSTNIYDWYLEWDISHSDWFLSTETTYESTIFHPVLVTSVQIKANNSKNFFWI